MEYQHRQYIKVPYAPKVQGEYTKDATVEQVQAALPAGVEGLLVDNDGGYPNVTFPQGTSYEIMKQVADHLRNQGFEVEL